MKEMLSASDLIVDVNNLDSYFHGGQSEKFSPMDSTLGARLTLSKCSKGWRSPPRNHRC